MTLGVLDLPGLLFGIINDLLLVALPLWVTLVFWAAVSGWATMWVYRAVSNQQALAALKPQIKAVQQKLAKYDDEFSGLIPLIRENFRLSGRQIGLAIGPALLAGIPVLFVLVWGSNVYGVHFPESGQPVNVAVESERWPRSADDWEWTGFGPGVGMEIAALHLPSAVGDPLRWRVAWPQASARLTTVEGEVVIELPPDVAVPVVHKRQWWNLLIGNPAGYLEPDNPAEAIQLALPAYRFVPWGPDWIRGWLFVYFVVVISVSLGFKSYWRVH